MSETTTQDTGSGQAVLHTAQGTQESEAANASNPLEEFGNNAMELGKAAWAKLKDVGENVSDKFGDMMSNAKLNTEKAQKQKEISDAYQKLGELAYRQGGLTGELAQVSDKIHTLYQELQNIEIQRNETNSK